MPDASPQFLNLSGSRKIAFLHTKAEPETAGGIFWAGGFNSNMTGTKASRLALWAAGQGLSCTRFDYSGHGASSGRFEDGTISDWLEEALVIFDKAAQGPQILIGSSMGGWIVLLMCLAHLNKVGVKCSRIKAIILIAPAVDMTEDLMWQRFPHKLRQQILASGVFMRPSAYGDGPYPITVKLIEDGRKHLVFTRRKTLKTHCPVRIIHGLKDKDVPWRHSVKLLTHLNQDDVQLNLVGDGDHRLSREEDIKRMIATVALVNCNY